MELSEEQVTEFEEKGWTVVPALFGTEERSILENAALRVSEEMPHSGRDATDLPSTCHGAHLYSDVLRALSHHPEVLTRARQLLGGREYYVHQSRVNHKNTKGSITDWHQDFGTYHRVDMLPEPDGIMIAIFVDDVTEVNAPLLALPGSHAEGLVPLVYRPDERGMQREDKGWHTFDDLDPEKAEENQCECAFARQSALLCWTFIDGTHRVLSMHVVLFHLSSSLQR